MSAEQIPGAARHPYENPQIKAVVQSFLPAVLEGLPYATRRRSFFVQVDGREAVFPFDDIGLEVRIEQTRVSPSLFAEAVLQRRPFDLVDVHVFDYLEPVLDRTYHILPQGIEVTGPNRYSGAFERRAMDAADVLDFQKTFERMIDLRI